MIRHQSLRALFMICAAISTHRLHCCTASRSAKEAMVRIATRQHSADHVHKTANPQAQTRMNAFPSP